MATAAGAAFVISGQAEDGDGSQQAQVALDSPASLDEPLGDAEEPSASPTRSESPKPTPEKAKKRSSPAAQRSTPTVQPKAPAPPKAVPRKAPAPESPVSSATERVVQLVNQERAAAGCGPVTINAKLTQAAESYSDVLAGMGELSHTGPDGSTAATRVEAEGYSWSLVGENIAQGYQDAEAAMEGWMNSPKHKANILNCDFREIGVGVHEGDGGPWWTQDFATSR